jgi:hypothetical protein
MHVIFVEPAFPTSQRDFVRALASTGAGVTAIGERPVHELDNDLKGWLSGYEQVSSVCNEGEMLETVRRIQSRGWVDRLETTIEAHIQVAANVRESAGIPGTSPRTAFLSRDKPAMKEALRRAGVACAASTGTDSADEARQFAREAGYPLILKPRDAAGAAGTWRANNDEELEAAIRESGLLDGASVAVEEFIEGHEGFYDTLAVDGQIRYEFISHYYPNVLEAMRTRWISPQLVTTNRLDAPDYGEVREMGARVIRELGIGTSATHMEWFFGPKGLKFSEIGTRPPGVGTWDLYCAANEFDLYREWALAVTGGDAAVGPTRRYAAGLIALRPEADGSIRGYSGVESVHERFGENIIDTHFPGEGTPTQPVEAGYMANAWVRVRHPDYDVLRGILDEIGRTVTVHAG